MNATAATQTDTVTNTSCMLFTDGSNKGAKLFVSHEYETAELTNYMKQPNIIPVWN